MIKEIVISIVIVVIIFIGNVFTENYTEKSIDETTACLSELRVQIEKDEGDIDLDSVKQKINEIQRTWNVKYEKLAYYIEHDELEKVKTELVGLKGYIEKEEYSEALPSIDRSIFILEHIKEKTKLNLKNIF